MKVFLTVLLTACLVLCLSIISVIFFAKGTTDVELTEDEKLWLAELDDIDEAAE